MWDLIKKILRAARIRYHPTNVKDLFGIDVAQVENTNNNSGPILSLAQQIARSREDEVKGNIVDHKALTNFTTAFLTELQNIQSNITNNVPPHPDCALWEHMLFCTRVTIYYDHWYDENENTRVRGQFIPHVDLLFILEMTLRFWRRHNIMLTEPSDYSNPSPIWYRPVDLNEQHWFQFLDDNSILKTPIIDWMPATVIRQIQKLMTQKHTEGVYLPDSRARDLFLSFTKGLADKIALCIVTKVPGTPEELSHFEPRNFRIYNSTTSTTDKVFVSEPSHLHLSKQVREHQQKDKEAFKRMLALEQETEEVKVSMSTKDKLDYIFVDKDNINIDLLKKELGRLKHKRQILIDSHLELKEIEKEFDDHPDISFICDEDKAELEVVKKNIADIESLITQYESKKTQDAHEAFESSSKQLDSTIASISHGTSTSHIRSVATVMFSRTAMLYYDFLRSWQLEDKKHIPIYSAEHEWLKQHIFKDVCATILIGSEMNTLANAQTWIISQSVTFVEREKWRLDYGSDSVFKSVDALIYNRGGDATELKNFSNIPAILKDPEHPYHYRFLEYAGYYWLQQNLRQVNIYSTCYVHDPELQCCTLDTPPLRTHCMSRMGNKFYIICPKSWNENDWLNAHYCGLNFMDCLTAWCKFLFENNWHIFDRSKNKTFSAQQTKIATVFEDARKAYLKHLDFLAKESGGDSSSRTELGGTADGRENRKRSGDIFTE